MTHFAFVDLGFSQLLLANAVDNTRSARIKEKQGAELIAVQPGAYVDPTITHQQLWKLTKDKYLTQKIHRF